MVIDRPVSRRLMPAACGLAAWVLAALPLVTQLDSGPAALRGLPGVAVLAEGTAPDVAPLGLSADRLAGRVSDAIRRHGVTVLERSDALSDPQQPLLVVRLHTLKLPTSRHTFAWCLTLGAHRRMAAPGDSAGSVLVQAWTATQVLGVNGADRLRASVLQSVDQKVAEFVAAWKSRDG